MPHLNVALERNLRCSLSCAHLRFDSTGASEGGDGVPSSSLLGQGILLVDQLVTRQPLPLFDSPFTQLARLPHPSWTTLGLVPSTNSAIRFLTRSVDPRTLSCTDLSSNARARLGTAAFSAAGRAIDLCAQLSTTRID